MLVEILTALGGVLAGGGVGALLRARWQNRLDASAARKAEAEAESIELQTARDLISELRAEMDRRVSALTREVGRLQGRLESVAQERDQIHAEAEALRRENRTLRKRIERLERRIAELTAERAAEGV